MSQMHAPRALSFGLGLALGLAGLAGLAGCVGRGAQQRARRPGRSLTP